MATEKRLIDANALSDLLDVEYKRKMALVKKGEIHLDTLAEGIMSVAILLGTMPTVDAVEVVHGRWIVDESGVIICSQCGAEHEWQDYRASFCEDCGAKMDGDGNG